MSTRISTSLRINLSRHAHSFTTSRSPLLLARSRHSAAATVAPTPTATSKPWIDSKPGSARGAGLERILDASAGTRHLEGVRGWGKEEATGVDSLDGAQETRIAEGSEGVDGSSTVGDTLVPGARGSKSIGTTHEPTTSPSTNSNGPSPTPDAADESVDTLGNDELDAVAEATRKRLQKAKKSANEIPTRAELEALRPTRLTVFLPDMSRGYYKDQFNNTARRLARAFSRDQLVHLVTSLGYADSKRRVLSNAGRRRCEELLKEGDKRGDKPLAHAVMEESPLHFLSYKRGPPDYKMTKRRLTEWIMVEHWELTDPSTIPPPADLATKAKRQMSNSEVFSMPYHEVYLLGLESTQDGKSSLLKRLSQSHNVQTLISQTPTGLQVKGPVKNRDKFKVALEKHRAVNKTFTREVVVPIGLGKVVLTPGFLRSVGELGGAYVEGEPKKGKFTAYARSESALELIANVFSQFASIHATSSRLPILLSPSSTNPTPALCMLPFVPRSEVPWHVGCVADAYGRMTYAKSRRREKSQEMGGLEVEELRGVRGNVKDLAATLLDIAASPEMGPLRLRATFGHLTFPRVGVKSAFGPHFSGAEAMKHFRRWNQDVLPGPAFLPAPQSDSLVPTPLTSQTPFMEDAMSNEDIKVHETRHVHVFSPSAEGNLDEASTLQLFRVTTVKSEMRVQKMQQRRVVVMIPDSPLDMMITAERYSKTDAEDPTSGAYTKDDQSFEFAGQTFVRTDHYISQHLDMASSGLGLPEEVKCRHERRKDVRFRQPGWHCVESS